MYHRTLRPQPTERRPARKPNRLSARQVASLAHAAFRELRWGLAAVAEQVDHWQAFARSIPDPSIREDALHAITQQRSHIDGAALFSTLPRARSPALLRLLVAYEIIWDFLDNFNERTDDLGVANGLQLHRALVDALDDDSKPVSAYYLHCPAHDDGGYLRKLVAGCRQLYEQMPSHAALRSAVARESRRALVCAINHDPSANRRDTALRNWANEEFPAGHEAAWFELTAAASTNLTVFALLALACESTCISLQIERVSTAYFPWISVLTAMLDSYVDQVDDAATGNHCYLAHYPTHGDAINRLCELMWRCLNEATALREAEKHCVIASCMFAMYLTKDSARSLPMRSSTRRLGRAAGPIARALYPVFLVWRAAYGLRDQ